MVLRLVADVVTFERRESSGSLFGFGRVPRSAIVRCNRSRSDLYLTQSPTKLVSLVPGTIVIEARQ